MLKERMVGVLIFLKCENKVRLRHGWGVICSKSKNKVRLGFTSIENAGIRYC